LTAKTGYKVLTIMNGLT